MPQKKIGSYPKNIADLKSRLKRASGGLIRYIPKESSMTVRFLAEPDKFIMYEDCWSAKEKKTFPFVEGMKEGADFDRKQTVFLACVVDREKDVVIPLQLKQSVLNSLVIRFERYKTLMDRDYEISRYGAGLDTTYEVESQAPQKINLAKYTALDLEDVLRQAYEDAFPEDEEEEERPRRGHSTTVATRRSRTQHAVEDDEEEEEEAYEPSVAEMKEMDWAELNEYARSLDVKLSTNKRSELIAAIEEKRDEF